MDFTGKESVLLVDDEFALLESLSDYILDALGLKVDVAISGIIALEMISAKSYDLVISDISMPLLGGVELLKLIRADYPTTDVVIMTGHRDVGLAVKVVREGAFDYLQKPFTSLSVVTETIKRVFVERKRKIDEEQEQMLKQQQDLERFKDKVGSSFSGAVCHHFSQPLTSIVADLGLNQRILKMLKEYAKEMDKNSCMSIGDFNDLFFDERPLNSMWKMIEFFDKSDRSINQSLKHLLDLLETVRSFKRYQDEAYVGEDRIVDLQASSRFVVLVVEDQIEQLEAYSSYLEMQGFSVITAFDGVEALRHIQYSRPHAAIFDLGVSHGCVIDSIISDQNDGQGSIPFVVFSGRERESVFKEYPQLKHDLFFGKGDPDALEKIVKLLKASICNHILQKGETEFRNNH